MKPTDVLPTSYADVHAPRQNVPRFSMASALGVPLTWVTVPFDERTTTWSSPETASAQSGEESTLVPYDGGPHVVIVIRRIPEAFARGGNHNRVAGGGFLFKIRTDSG